MEIRSPIKEQYHAGLAMLAQCVQLCPEDLWTALSTYTPPSTDSDDHRQTVMNRSFWRIAFHGAFFTHLYLGQGEDAFQPPPNTLEVGRRDDLMGLWHAPWDLEPFDLPDQIDPCSRQEILEYISFVGGLIDPTVDALDLETQSSGFTWYKRITKLSHQLMNLRHIQGHVGQLSELLLQRGIDIDWRARSQKQQ